MAHFNIIYVLIFLVGNAKAIYQGCWMNDIWPDYDEHREELAFDRCRRDCQRIFQTTYFGLTGKRYTTCYCGDNLSGTESDEACNQLCDSFGGPPECGSQDSRFMSVFSVCDQGKYGDSCSMECLESGCQNNVCMFSTGRCCVSGKYGSSCDKTCSPNCDGACQPQTGRCTYCVDGWFGDKCDMLCPETCLEQNCTREVGQCINGCLDGYYGNLCNSRCNSRCKGGICDVSDGRCTLGCEAGWFGDQCLSRCPANCQSGECDKTDGRCTLGCKVGHSGKFCEINKNYLPVWVPIIIVIMFLSVIMFLAGAGVSAAVTFIIRQLCIMLWKIDCSDLKPTPDSRIHRTNRQNTINASRD